MEQPDASAASPLVVKCPNPDCGKDSPKGKHFCADCGTPLDMSLNQMVRHAVTRQVRETLGEQVKDRKILEVETAVAVATRVWHWVKLVAAVAGVAVAVLVVAFTFFGYSQLSDIDRTAKKAKDDIAGDREAVAQAKSAVDKMAPDIENMKRQVAQVDRLQSDVNRIHQMAEDVSGKVDKLQQELDGTPFPPHREQKLQDLLAPFRQYLQAVGFASAAMTIPIRRANPGQQFPFYYLPDRQVIIVGDAFVDDPLGLAHEYANHALLSDLPDDVRPPGGFFANNAFNGLEAGLADYYPCSYADRPDGLDNAIRAGWKRMGIAADPPPHDLKNDRKFLGLSDETWYEDGSLAWGGAFWDLRNKISKEKTDKLLLAGWQSIQPGDLEAGASAGAKRFLKRLLDAAKDVDGGRHVEAIKDVFKARGLQAD